LPHSRCNNAPAFEFPQLCDVEIKYPKVDSQEELHGA
jgi:hypothetical protein